MALEPNAYTGRTTTLEAVNMHLSAIGKSNISSLLAVDRSSDVEAALRVLLQTSRQVQGKGWHFNTIRDFVINPQAITGVITLPANVLRVESAGQSEDMDLVERDGKLWNNDENTFNVGKAVHVDYVALLPYEQIPEYARHYIAVKSVRIFAAGKTDSTSTFNFTNKNEDDAMNDALSADKLLEDRTLRRSKHVSRMLRVGRNRTRG